MFIDRSLRLLWVAPAVGMHLSSAQVGLVVKTQIWKTTGCQLSFQEIPFDACAFLVLSTHIAFLPASTRRIVPLIGNVQSSRWPRSFVASSPFFLLALTA